MILFRKIANFFLAVLLLVATTGVTLNKHYCMGRLKSVAVFQKAQNCMGEGLDDPMPCCEDVSEELKVEEITNASFEFKGSPDLYQITVIAWVLVNQPIYIEKDKTEFLNYIPPPQNRDIPVLIQSFLI